MMSSAIDADTIFAVDVGSVNTRASLFDVVDGRYRLVASARAPSTGGHPLFDVSEGVRIAIDRIQLITKRRLVDESELLIMPVTSQGAGVDIFVATTSAGPRVRSILVGLMPGVSVQSARRLAASTYLDVVGEIGLMDTRRDSEKIELIVTSHPDVILITGGTDGGAGDSVLQLIDLVDVATAQIPAIERPRIVYAGNQSLSAAVTERMGDRLDLVLAPNVRPSLRYEDTNHARIRIAEAISHVRSTKVSGLQELEHWSGGYLMLSADAFGRVVRYLSRIYEPEKGVLGVDVGANQVTVAAGFEGDLRLHVNTQFGLGKPIEHMLDPESLAAVIGWLPVESSPTRLREYIYNKASYPSVVPADMESLYFEFALAREMIIRTLKEARRNWPSGKNIRSRFLLPHVEPILATGSVLSRSPHPGFAALALLDSVQPTGITTLVLDPHGLSPSLGAVAGPLPMVAVHTLESGSFISLGTIVSPTGSSRMGRRILRVQLEREAAGEDMLGDVRMGQVIVLPLKQGESAKLTVRPERGIDVGFGGPGKAGALRVTGGALGLIIDARGRPLRLPSDPDRRRELNEQWLYDIGALT